jgi:hypothetical protein
MLFTVLKTGAGLYTPPFHLKDIWNICLQKKEDLNNFREYLIFKSA